MAKYVLCSECFHDQGLRLDAVHIGLLEHSRCANCGATTGRKLDRDLIEVLAQRFFVWGSLRRYDYGAAPAVQFNEHQATSINTAPWLEPDLRIIEKAIGVGFFHYGPRLWMLGEVEPLKALQNQATRASMIERIIAEYPTVWLTPGQLFYRLRKAPANPTDFDEYDSPPVALAGSGRLDSRDFPVMYGSQDLQVCLHECRVVAEDDLFVATLASLKDMKLLDLTELLNEQTTEFESLDMAVHMLFLAGSHSYHIAREIAPAAYAAGYDGLVYPSYFSLLCTGAMPFETAYGISMRRLPQLAGRERSKIIRNLALFGRALPPGLPGQARQRQLNQASVSLH